MDKLVTWLVRRGIWALVAIAVAWIGSRGCGPGGDNSGVSAQAVAKAKLNWQLQLDWDGTTVQMPVERMDIYVMEDEEYPEIFDLSGEGVALVGTLPVAVGYEEAFDRLMGKPIAILPSGGDPREIKYSHVTIDGRSVPVSSGFFTVERVTGQWDGLEGDKTLWGTIELRVTGATGERVVTGKLAVHVVTWG